MSLEIQHVSNKCHRFDKENYTISFAQPQKSAVTIWSVHQNLQVKDSTNTNYVHEPSKEFLYEQMEKTIQPSLVFLPASTNQPVIKISP